MDIISVTPSEARKLDGPTNMFGSSDYIDYSDRRSIPVSIPDFKHEEKNGDKFVVRNILSKIIGLNFEVYYH